MRKHVFVFIYAFVVMAYTVCAQHVQVLPPSPEAASLNKYIEYPVSYFSGLPQINIPIYEIRVDDVVLPISLSYHGGGIQADEEASRVGLGWTLNAGGAVIRSMRGLPDELGSTPSYMAPTTHNIMTATTVNYRGYEKLNSIDTYILQKMLEKTGEDTRPYVSNDPVLQFYYMIQTWFKTYYETGLMDVAPDNYSFNFMGNSGVFVMDQGKAIVQTESQIHFKQRTNYGFIFEDKENNKYYFEESETSYHPWPLTAGRPDSISYKSAWYLNKIETPQGKTITLRYSEMPKIRTYGGRSEEWQASRYETVPSVQTHSQHFAVVAPKRLDKIETNDLKIEFISSNEVRKDIHNDRSRLDYIIVKNYQDETLKKVGFNYSYFSTSSPPTTVDWFYPLNYRLKLDEIKEYSITGNNSYSLHKFTYHGNGIIPEKHTSRKDYWGYFNNNSNSTLIPRGALSSTTFVGPSKPADRNPHSSEMIKGTLSSITYSTGGKTNFIWEAHDYSYVKQTPVNKISGLPPVEKPVLTAKLCGLKSNTLEKLSADIRVNILREIKLYVNNYFRGLEEFMTSGLFSGYHTAYQDGMKVPLVKIYYLDPAKNNTPVLKDILVLNKWFYEKYSNKPYYVYNPNELGDYRIVLENPRGTMVNATNGYGMLRMFEDEAYYQSGSGYGTIPIEYEKETESSSGVNPVEIAGMAMAGGLRIKQIESITNNDTIRKQYIYRDPLMPLNSSGVLVEQPNCYSYYVTGYDHFTGTVFYTVDVMNADGIYKSFPSKQNVEYQVVLEYSDVPVFGQDPTEKIGQSRTEYYYSTVKDGGTMDVDDTVGTSNLSASSRVRTYRGYRRGNLLKEITYSHAFKVKETNYEYYIYEDPEPYYFIADLITTVDFANMGVTGAFMYDGYRIIPHKNYGISKYRLIPYNKMIKSRKQTTKSLETKMLGGFYIDVHDYIEPSYEEQVTYKYQSQEYSSDLKATMPLSEERTTSDGKKEIIYYSYYSKGGKVHTEVRVVDGYIVEARRFEYEQNRWLLLNTYTADIPTDRSISASSYSLGSSYYASSNLLQLINVPEYTIEYNTINSHILIRRILYKGVYTYYLWGYKGSHPVAEIKFPQGDGGFSLSTHLSSIGLTYEDVYNYTNVDDILGELRTKYPRAEITTFSYHWMLGLYTRTDPRGVQTYYNYDNYGRLKTIKDHNQHVIQQFDYHYRNQ